jgi:subtilisin family serine protease
MPKPRRKSTPTRAAKAVDPADVGPAVAALAQTIGDARTILFVHGIGNKPIPSILKCQWDHALFGFDLGERSRLAYWVNREYYPAPEGGTCKSGDLIEIEDEPTGRGLSVKEHLKQAPLEDEADAITTNDAHKRVLAAIGRELEANAALRAETYEGAYKAGVSMTAGAQTRAVEARSVEAKILPLPRVLREWITRKLTRALLRDVNDFLFVQQRRERMRDSVRERLRTGGGPFAVIGHSQGSLIAYDVLSAPEFKDLDVRLFVTIGSPLGIQEVQDQLRQLTGQPQRLRVPACVDRWLNVADPLDPVAFDKELRNDFAPNDAGVRIQDDREWNPDSPRHPHSGSGYLRTAPVRNAVRECTARELFQPVADFVVARDVVRALENGGHRVRQAVLIELTEPTTSSERTLGETREDVVNRILDLAKATAKREDRPFDQDVLRIEPLTRYVSANLTREEAEELASVLPSGTRAVSRIWRNSRKVALLDSSINTVQALPAHISYHAYGRGVTWAVLDSGVNPEHPHFSEYATIECRYDCTVSIGKKLPTVAQARATPLAQQVGMDENGHGTHVAGIIAGMLAIPPEKKGAPSRTFTGMAPETKIHSYKVLDREGNGEDAWIIKALDHIADTNERAGQLVVHGVNLSLGGPFDQSTFGCGHTPLCKELRRLWRQGVVVVLAAGNEGFAVIQTLQGTIDANMDLSIGDPANLEDAIAVGSVHKTNPHSYGVSFFSSRGPTADGRQKPDLVAPGERILSCRHVFTADSKRVDGLYVEMSGTSMAAPHVSGLLAAFLSIRREFIGEPDRVKALLLKQCTDLGRDKPQQGAGMPNLIKMLVAT